MESQDMVLYLANVILVAGANGNITEAEAQAIEAVRLSIGASQTEMKEALHRVSQGRHQMTPVGRLSERIRNLEDMIFTAISDGEISKSERPGILSFAKTIKVSQGQINEMLSEAKGRSRPEKTSRTCPSCGEQIEADAIFCSACGHRV